MLLGKVVGTVVSTRKVESIEGLKLLSVRELNINDGKEKNNYVVAVDAVQAGIGDIVLYATGSAARQTIETLNKPADAVIMAIVDICEVGGKVIYRKESISEKEVPI
jgi:microcompartment protein CcmK/EutM